MVLYRWCYHSTHDKDNFLVTARHAGAQLRTIWQTSTTMKYKTFCKRCTLSDKIMWLAYQKSDILGSWWEDINITDAPQVNISIITKVWIAGGKSSMSSLETVCKQV